MYKEATYHVPLFDRIALKVRPLKVLYGLLALQTLEMSSWVHL